MSGWIIVPLCFVLASIGRDAASKEDGRLENSGLVLEKIRSAQS